jgi:prevent-host-death family protein
MESRSTQDARRDFAALIEDVLRGEHVELTRYGRPVAVIVPHDWYERASADPSRFRVAGFDDEGLNFTQPVEVRCERCGEARTFTDRDDGGADHTESLSVLLKWAQDHQCKETGA